MSVIQLDGYLQSYIKYMYIKFYPLQLILKPRKFRQTHMYMYNNMSASVFNKC